MRLDMSGNGPRGPTQIEFIEEPTVQTATTARPFVLSVLRAAVSATVLVGALLVGALLGVSSVTVSPGVPAPAAAAATLVP